MKVKIENGMLVIALPVDDKLPLSKSGKARILATTHGFAAGGTFNDLPVSISLNATVPVGK